jgi:ribonucleoside-diphosphate reductase subunit M2
MSSEPILQESDDRFLMHPIQYSDLWNLFNKQRKTFWSESEVSLKNDVEQFSALEENEQFFIKRILAFFAAADGIVMENLSTRFATEVQLPELRAFYAAQNYIEVVHSIMYSQLLNIYITDERERQFLFNSIHSIPVVKKKADWARRWIGSSDSFVTRLVAFLCVEGIFFSGAFCSIFWIKERGILKGLTISNDWISRDEGLHCEMPTLLYVKYIVNKLSDTVVHQIVQEAVDIETEFIVDSIPCNLIGINAESMVEYIQYVANRLVVQLGHTPIHPDAKCPFDFMDRICFDTKSNFFEETTTAYQLRAESTLEDDTLTFNPDAEF